MPMLARRTSLLALALLASGAAPSLARAEPVTIRIGYAAIGLDDRPYAEGTSAATARAGNYVEDAFKGDPDVKVEWYFFKGAGPAVNEGIANDQLDFAYEGDLPSIIGRANGLTTELLLASGAHKPTYVVTPAGSALASIKDLKGRKVAVQRGTNNHLSFVKVLEANGLKERDLQVINMDDATANAALAAGQIDAAVGDTALIALAQRGLARVLYTTKGDDPRFGRYASVLVTEKFEHAHPDLTQRVTDAFVRAAAWSSDEANRDAVLDLWTKGGTPKPILAEFFSGETLNYRNTPLLDPLFVDHYRDAAAKSREFGFLRRDVTFDGWFQTKYLDQAIKDLKLEGTWKPYAADGKPATD